MGDVVPFVRGIGMAVISAALDEITNAYTEAVVLVSAEGAGMWLRSFGDKEKCKLALRAALEAMEE